MFWQPTRHDKTPKVETPASEATPLIPDADLVSLSATSVRHGFVQKVYGILSFQLIITTIVAGLIYHFCKSWSADWWTIFLVTLVVDSVLFIGLLCLLWFFPNLMRVPPANYALLAVLTLSESVLVGLISTQYTQESVLIALAITALIVVSLTIFACQTTYDFTGMGPYILAAMMCLSGFLLALVLAGCLGLSDPAFHTAMVALAAIAAFVFSMYIVHDTQLIIGGKNKQHQFSIDDYCMAAMTIYVDIIELFIVILMMVGERK